ncbi:hypothetical protein NL676_028918 [Syzygium grande]|nr:hypothetical protein NL676_028918 [Syzygium grande]
MRRRPSTRSSLGSELREHMLVALGTTGVEAMVAESIGDIESSENLGYRRTGDGRAKSTIAAEVVAN